MLNDLIDAEDPQTSLITLKQAFEDIEANAQATAILMLDFIYTIRDLTDESSVLSAFFEGFEFRAQYGLGSVASASVAWKASPMLKAIANTQGRPLVQIYENFVRDLLSAARRANSDNWGTWQREYDHEFQTWMNFLQSGMFKSDHSFDYTG